MSGPLSRFRRCSLVSMLACLPRHALNSKTWSSEHYANLTAQVVLGACAFFLVQMLTVLCGEDGLGCFDEVLEVGRGEDVEVGAGDGVLSQFAWKVGPAVVFGVGEFVLLVGGVEEVKFAGIGLGLIESF